jgi:hypothetical protein
MKWQGGSIVLSFNIFIFILPSLSFRHKSSRERSCQYLNFSPRCGLTELGLTLIDITSSIYKSMGKVPTSVQPESKEESNGDKVKALAWFGVQDVRLVDALFRISPVNQTMYLIVKVTGTTICGSDLHL